MREVARGSGTDDRKLDGREGIVVSSAVGAGDVALEEVA